MLPGSLAAVQAKTLVYCSEGSPEHFNPMLNTTCTTFDANEPIYNRLVQFKPGSTEIAPALAERWEVSPDGKVFASHLRHGPPACSSWTARLVRRIATGGRDVAQP